MSQNDQTLKQFWSICCKIFKLYVNFLGYYALKDQNASQCFQFKQNFTFAATSHCALNQLLIDSEPLHVVDFSSCAAACCNMSSLYDPAIAWNSGRISKGSPVNVCWFIENHSFHFFSRECSSINWLLSKNEVSQCCRTWIKYPFNPLQPDVAFLPLGFLMFSGGIEKQHRAVRS